jgi:hypothetical protein
MERPSLIKDVPSGVEYLARIDELLVEQKAELVEGILEF